MKQYIFLIICIASFVTISDNALFANNENESVQDTCPPYKKYPYKVCCDYAGIRTVCISNIQEYEATHPGCKVRKIPDYASPRWKYQGLPICIDTDYFKKNYSTLNFYKDEARRECIIDNNNEEITYPVFDTTGSGAASRDIIEACRQWNAICGLANAPCKTQIKVRFSINLKKDFDNDIYTVAVTKYPWPYTNLGVLGKPGDQLLDVDRCDMDLDLTEIIFNNTPEFVKCQKDKYGNYLSQQWFWVNQDFISNDLLTYIDAQNVANPNQNGEPPYMLAFNFRDVLMHELGHILAFGHYEECIEENGNNTDYAHGVMERQANPVTGKTAGLSMDDKCMFKRLYCPTTLDINEHEYNSDANNLYPNPSYDEAKLEFDIEAEYDVVTIRIQDNLGRTLLVPIANREYGKGSHLELIDVQSLPNGYYYCIIQTQRKNYVKPFVVIR